MKYSVKKVRYGDQHTNQFFGVGEGLNLESLIQPLKTLSVKLVETYY